MSPEAGDSFFKAPEEREILKALELKPWNRVTCDDPQTPSLYMVEPLFRASNSDPNANCFTLDQDCDGLVTVGPNKQTEWGRFLSVRDGKVGYQLKLVPLFVGEKQIDLEYRVVATGSLIFPGFNEVCYWDTSLHWQRIGLKIGEETTLDNHETPILYPVFGNLRKAGSVFVLPGLNKQAIEVLKRLLSA